MIQERPAGMRVFSFGKTPNGKYFTITPARFLQVLGALPAVAYFCDRMKNSDNPMSRQSTDRLFCSFRHRRPLRSAGKLLLCYFTYLCLLPALLGSCRKETPPEPEPADGPAPVADSVATRICLQADGAGVGRVDLFVYDTEGVGGLEQHAWMDTLRTEFSLPTLPGDKRVVAIANSPHKLNTKALSRYDAMEKLLFSFVDDDPQRPVLGGSCTTHEQEGTVVLQPLLCQVVLASVSNTMDGFDLLEEPRIRLRDLPAGAEILRDKDFRPTELLDAGEWAPLPCDVGFFTQEPRVTLWCYPNDTPADVLGVPRPTLEFSCRIRGETCSFDIPLPPLPRASRVEVDLTVGGPDEHSYKFRQE